MKTAANAIPLLNFQDINDFVLENKDRPLEKLKVMKPMPKFNQLMHDLGLFRAHTKSIKVVTEKIAKLDRQLDLGKLISKAMRISYASVCVLKFEFHHFLIYHSIYSDDC